MDDLLSQALTKLSFEEREEHQDVLHGVNDTPTEDVSFLNSALKELENQLANTKTGSFYEIAETMDPAFVNATPFRVMFLRAKEYDAKAAAEQMLLFFESKHQLFGKDKLVKHITIADLDEDDIAYLKQAFVQFAGRDRSGRQVIVHIGAFVAGIVGAQWSKKTLQNVLRAQYYGLMKALQSEETQIRGIVSVWYAIGDLKAKSRKGYHECFKAVWALPQKKAAIHLCVDDIKQYALFSVVVKLMPANVRARMRLHFGSLTECKYQLSTYGILPESLPFDANGNIDPDQQIQWINSCMMDEQSDRPISASPSRVLELTTTPTQNDVLFTGQVSNHPGNQLYRNLIIDFSHAYDSRTDEMKKQIVSEIIAKIHDIGGRFLRKQEKGRTSAWEEVPSKALRKKIMQAFRNRRRRLDAYSKETAMLIEGEPLPRDVIFGRAQRNPGSELFQRLIKDHSQEYNSLDRGVKMRLVERIMKIIKNQGGRFLEPAPEKGQWVELLNDHARERISMYFRNHRRPRNAS